MPPLTRAPWVVAALVLPLLVAAPSPARAAARTCDGQAATLVGAPDRDVTGTDGRDVIVTNGSQSIDAKAGDDLVCVTRGPVGDLDLGISLAAGPGDDVVRSTLGDQDYLITELGVGSDTFVGGVESDLVTGGSYIDPSHDNRPQDDAEPDAIDTGSGGLDLVWVGDGGPLADQVRVARYGSVLAFAPGLAEGASLTSTANGTLDIVTDVDARWDVDAVAQDARADGAATPAFTWSGFRRYAFSTPGVVDFTGTDQKDVIAGPVVDADLGGGDDRVDLYPSTAQPDVTGTVDGGPGTDRMRLVAGFTEEFVVRYDPADITVDVARQRAGFAGHAPVTLARFEQYGAQTDRAATLVGGPGRDLLYGAACDLTMSGGAGDDRITQEPGFRSAGFDSPQCADQRDRADLAGGAGDDVVHAEAYRSTTTGGSGDDRLWGGDLFGARSVEHGGSGDDVLRGGNDHDVLVGGPGSDGLLGYGGDDRLVGGAGRDVATGGRGDDVCLAEHATTCERTRSG